MEPRRIACGCAGSSRSIPWPPIGSDASGLSTDREAAIVHRALVPDLSPLESPAESGSAHSRRPVAPKMDPCLLEGFPADLGRQRRLEPPTVGRFVAIEVGPVVELLRVAQSNPEVLAGR